MKQKKKGISRQRAWQIKKVSEGLCAICGKKLIHYKHYCDEHAIKNRIRKRIEKYGENKIIFEPRRLPFVAD